MKNTVNHAKKQEIISQLSSMGISGDRPIEELAQSVGLNLKCVPLTDGVGMGKDAFASLAMVASTCADTELFILDIYSQDNTDLVMCGLDYYELKTALSSNSNFSTFDVMVVGHSCKWVACLRGLAGGVLIADGGLLALGEPCNSKLLPYLCG